METASGSSSLSSDGKVKAPSVEKKYAAVSEAQQSTAASFSPHEKANSATMKFKEVLSDIDLVKKAKKKFLAKHDELLKQEKADGLESFGKIQTLK